uniref:NCKPL n=1 Tax=Macrostomum lignano TaxID=282301 RepID=A0A1I8F935_9PLAT
ASRRRAISCRSGSSNPARPGAEPWPPIVGHVRHLLNSEQKAADFRHQSAVQDGAPASAVALRTPAPRCLGGEHLHKVQVLPVLAACKRCATSRSTLACLKTGQALRVSLLTAHDLYDVLCKLLNLLVIQPANLHDICEEEFASITDLSARYTAAVAFSSLCPLTDSSLIKQITNYDDILSILLPNQSEIK